MVGLLLGHIEGIELGSLDGTSVGDEVGALDGAPVGTPEGDVGEHVGHPLG